MKILRPVSYTHLDVYKRQEVGAAGPQDMGKVMGVATKKLAGKAEGRAISAKVKELLG